MPPDETLNAVIQAKDQASTALEGIAESLRDVAQAATATATATQAAAEGIDEVGDEAAESTAELVGLRAAMAGLDGADIDLDTNIDVDKATLDSVRQLQESTGEVQARVGRVRSDADPERIERIERAMDAIDEGAQMDFEGVEARRDPTRAGFGWLERDPERVKLDADTTRFDRKFENIQSSLTDFNRTRYTTQLVAENRGSKRAIHEAQRSLSDFVDSTETDTDRAKRGLRGLRGTFHEVVDDIGGATLSEEIGRRFDSRGDARVDVPGVVQAVNRSLGVDVPDTKGIRSELDSIRGSVQKLPPMRMNIEDREGLMNFAGDLQRAQHVSSRLNDSLQDIDDDSLIAGARSAGDLRRSLSRTSRQTDELERDLEGLEGATRDYIDDLIATSTTLDQFERQVEQTGDAAVKTSAKIQQMEGQTADITLKAAIAAKSVDKFGDEIDDAGDEALGTAAQLQAMNAAMRSVGPSIGDVSTRMLGFKTSLVTVARVMPMILSLTAAIGGLATAALGATGALTGLFAGGMLAIGERLGNQLAAANEGVEDLEGNAKDAVEAESQLGRTMAGVAELMDRVKQAAYEAMEPLMTDEAADFAIRGIEGALTLLHEFAQGVASMQGLFLGFADRVGGVWWEEFPAIADAAARATANLLPMFERLLVGTIRRLPGFFDRMSEHGAKILPLLFDLGAAFLDVLPGLLHLGTGMLTLAIPALEGVALALEWLTPLMIWAGGVMEWLGTTFRGPIKHISAMVVAVYALSTAFGTLLFVGRGVAAIFGGALGHVAGFFTLLGKWAGKAIVAARAIGLLSARVAAFATGVGLILTLGTALSYFDLWDDVLGDLISKWNKLIYAIAFGGDFIEGIVADLVNRWIEQLNRLIGWANKVMWYEIPTIEPLGEPTGAEQFRDMAQIDPARADQIGGTLNMSERGGDGMTPTPSNAGSTASQPGRGRGGSEPWMRVDTIHVDSSPETNDAEIKSAVQEAINESETESRQRYSTLN